MRRIYELFPEVLLIDATHGTNNANYKLLSFMVHSTFGGGEHVQVSFYVRVTSVSFYATG